MRKEVTDKEVYCMWNADEKGSVHFTIKRKDFDDILNSEGKEGMLYYINDISPLKKHKDRVKIEIRKDKIQFTFRQNGKDVEKIISFNELKNENR